MNVAGVERKRQIMPARHMFCTLHFREEKGEGKMGENIGCERWIKTGFFVA